MKVVKGILAAATAGALVAIAFFLGSGYFERWRQALEIRRLKTVIDRLESERRVAKIHVMSKTFVEEIGTYRTTLTFEEQDAEGKPLPAKTVTAIGEEVYFEALVIKFNDEFIENADVLKGHSLSLFRRIFGSDEKPSAGFPVYTLNADGIPDVYRLNSVASNFEKDLWERFWFYANNPAEARKLGVRVLQAEAVGNRLVENKTYTLSLESDGGLNLVAFD